VGKGTENLTRSAFIGMKKGEKEKLICTVRGKNHPKVS